MPNVTYTHIVFASDLTEELHSPHIMEKLRNLSKLYEAKLHILHVVENLPAMAFTYVAGPPGLQDEMVDAAKKEIKKIARSLAVEEGNQHVINGNPKHAIIDFINNLDEDGKSHGKILLVMASHSRSELSVMLLGSTTNAVLHNVPCDTLVLRATEERKTGD